MAEAERYTNLVMGSGNGGMQLAWHLARLGERTIVVERKWIGGACPNVNCLPTKNEIWSAKVASLARQGANFGVMTGPVTIDMACVRKRKRDMVDELRDETIQVYKDSGAELILGSGTFVAPKTLEVKLNDGGTRTIAGDRIFLDLGTRAIVPDIAGLATSVGRTSLRSKIRMSPLR